MKLKYFAIVFISIFLLTYINAAEIKSGNTITIKHENLGKYLSINQEGNSMANGANVNRETAATNAEKFVINEKINAAGGTAGAIDSGDTITLTSLQTGNKLSYLGPLWFLRKRWVNGGGEGENYKPVISKIDSIKRNINYGDKIKFNAEELILNVDQTRGVDYKPTYVGEDAGDTATIFILCDEKGVCEEQEEQPPEDKWSGNVQWHKAEDIKLEENGKYYDLQTYLDENKKEWVENEHLVWHNAEDISIIKESKTYDLQSYLDGKEEEWVESEHLVFHPASYIRLTNDEDLQDYLEEEPTCEDDSECNEGEVCEQGICVPGEVPAECEDDSECNEGEVCEQGICVSETPETPFTSIDIEIPAGDSGLIGSNWDINCVDVLNLNLLSKYAKLKKDISLQNGAKFNINKEYKFECKYGGSSRVQTSLVKLNKVTYKEIASAKEKHLIADNPKGTSLYQLIISPISDIYEGEDTFSFQAKITNKGDLNIIVTRPEGMYCSATSSPPIGWEAANLEASCEEKEQKFCPAYKICKNSIINLISGDYDIEDCLSNMPATVGSAHYSNIQDLHDQEIRESFTNFMRDMFCRLVGPLCNIEPHYAWGELKCEISEK